MTRRSPLDGPEARPIAVPDLDEAARILGKQPAKVKRAAAKTTPYPHADGTLYYSLAQIERVLAGRPAVPPPEPNGHRAPKLSREDAETAALLAEDSNLAQVAAAAGVTREALAYAWRYWRITVNRSAA